MLDDVKEYYGRQLQSSADLQTNACCDQPPPPWLKPVLDTLHPEVVNRYYGCGLVAPPLLEGARVLDLGCGSGRDVYLLSALVGESGSVLGIDMTSEQLAVARRYTDYHREQFGYREGNVEFREGYIEQLDTLGLDDDSFDIVVSNCVINLSPDKDRVLRQVHRVLKPGGEFYFSDVYADRRLPDPLRKDPVLYGECLAGALYWIDFLNLAKRAGFADPRLVEDRPLSVDNAAIATKLGPVRFYSATYRLFKLQGLEPACENYGQVAAYRGTVPGMPGAFPLDKHHRFATGREVPVCGNTYRVLSESRLAPHFGFTGDFDCHYGVFPGCGEALPFDGGDAAADQTEGVCC